MTFIPVNFDEAVEAQPAPAGRYELQILKAQLTESGPNSKNPGSPQFRVTLGFANGALPSSPNRGNPFRFAAPESIQSSALTPVHTLPGSLRFAGGLLVSLSAFTIFDCGR